MFRNALAIVMAICWVIQGLIAPANAQDKDEIVVKLKLFDSNEPNIELIPKSTIVHLRDRVTGQPQLRRDVALTASPDQKGFYQVLLPKNRLIETFVISVSAASGTNYNPAVLSKIVTANDMVVYPGASNPGDSFGFSAYVGQLTIYKTILSHLLDEFGETQEDVIRKELKDTYTEQLKVMEQAEAKGKLSALKPEQLETARKVLDETLKLYGLREENPVDTPEIIYYSYPPSCSQHPTIRYYETTPCRPRIFRIWRR